MTPFRIVLAVLLSVWIASTALSSPDDDEREGGIVGTGILGTVTALGGITVNGQDILMNPELAVTQGISVATAADLVPGHTVAIIAQQENAQWRATYVRQVVPLVGPLQRSPDGHLTVMGTGVVASDVMSGDIAVGDWVAVSGLWQSERVMATRIDRVRADSRARIEGTALGFEPGQLLRIGGTDLTGVPSTQIHDGDVIRATGSPLEMSLQVNQLETGVFAGTPNVVLSEGYFSAPMASGLYTLLGSNIVSYTDNPDMIDPTTRQYVCSRMGRLFPAAADQDDAGVASSILADCLSDVPSIIPDRR